MVYHDKYNIFWIKHFLLCNKIATGILKDMGLRFFNFANLIHEQRNGVFANAQMTAIFWSVEKTISNLRGCDKMILFECLEDEYDISLKEMSEWTEADLEILYRKVLPSIIL